MPDNPPYGNCHCYAGRNSQGECVNCGRLEVVWSGGPSGNEPRTRVQARRVTLSSEEAALALKWLDKAADEAGWCDLPEDSRKLSYRLKEVAM